MTRMRPPAASEVRSAVTGAVVLGLACLATYLLVTQVPARAAFGGAAPMYRRPRAARSGDLQLAESIQPGPESAERYQMCTPARVHGH